MPVLSALAAGLLMASLNSLMRVCDINLIFRVILLILFGLNPMFVYYAGNGDPTILGLFLLGVALTALISWSVTDQTRHLAAAGLVDGTRSDGRLRLHPGRSRIRDRLHDHQRREEG